MYICQSFNHSQASREERETEIRLSSSADLKLPESHNRDTHHHHIRDNVQHPDRIDESLVVDALAIGSGIIVG